MSKSLVLALFLFSLLVSCVVVANPIAANTVTPNSWVELAPIHQARSNLQVSVVNGEIYALGGLAENGSVCTNEQYNPDKNNWVFKTPMPVTSSAFETAVYNNKIYCIAQGLNELYNPATDFWENKSIVNLPENWLANVVGDKIYIISPSVTLAYDPLNDSWSTKTPMPISKLVYASAVINNRVYIIGSNFGAPSSSSLQIYDPKTDSWSTGSTPPLATAGGAGATTGVNAPKEIYVIGDESTKVYNQLNDTWSFGAAMPTDRSEIGIAVLNDKLYAIGGSAVHGTWSPYGETYTVTYLNNVEVYTPFGYGTVSPTISIDTPKSINYSSNELSLDFTTSKPVIWIAYSLDGRQNVTIVGNTTLTGLSSGQHNFTVYANDTFGNMGASQTVTFTIQQPFSVPTVVAVSGVIVVVVVTVVLVFYYRKRRG